MYGIFDTRLSWRFIMYHWDQCFQYDTGINVYTCLARETPRLKMYNTSVWLWLGNCLEIDLERMLKWNHVRSFIIMILTSKDVSNVLVIYKSIQEALYYACIQGKLFLQDV